MKNLIYLLATVLILTSCKNLEQDNNDAMSETEAQAAMQDSLAALPEVKLHIFDGGSVLAKQKVMFSEGDRYEGESIQLAAPFYVIQHPEGTLLWDTGLPEGLVGQGDVTPEGDAFTISRSEKIVDQLASVGLTPADIDMIAFSHVHFDHTGGANNFANAKWLVQDTEMDFINSDAIKGNAFYAPDSFSKLSNSQILNGDYDIFSDGSVVIKSFPGHTAGHQALYLSLKESGPTLLSGDTYHFEQNREDAVVPQFNYDIPESKTSIEEFEAFAKAKNATVIIQHDLEDFKSTVAKTPMK
ncbi:Glyoxylase, beta-lactamase superfamily II [Nonlabens sp. Hel1_33_55]|uniref:N-acyl homoserine lactonase family protein n=1 Tax=Nonlabens sp. Hel1_33_55 TaxID=1336802 RepID=UPI000875E29F|nr:N-acyl homoserine lactonase family protein [Nonlabens sp. Hel1_33_55]SCY31633.1 Glyoxylase, beta-lactamase superfamily II [Nonlabens sp. Hel1_33_55]